MSLFASIAALSMPGAAPAAVPADDYRQRRPEDEVVYFLLPDRFENGDPANDKGGLEGDRLATGYDPAAQGFFPGGHPQGENRRRASIPQPRARGTWVLPGVRERKEGEGRGGRGGGGGSRDGGEPDH